MPWPNAKSFRKHNKRAKGKKGDKAARMATHILEKTGNEGEAIATANKFLSRQRGHNSPAPGPHLGLTARAFGVKKTGGGIGHSAPRPGGHGPRASRGMHRFGSIRPPGGGLINR